MAVNLQDTMFNTGSIGRAKELGVIHHLTNISSYTVELFIGGPNEIFKHFPRDDTWGPTTAT